MKVIINVAGAPAFFLNNQPIVFPTQKIAALVYYLFLEREVSRLKLATLFWGEKEEDAAAGNLRNAIYLIKKIIPEELIAVDRRRLKITPDANISLDIDSLDRLEHCSIEEVQKLGLEFMEGFSVTGSEEFETWLRQKRFDCAEKFENNIRLRIQAQKQNKKWDDVAQCLKLLIKKDSLDEKNYLQLMQLYASTGRTSKAFKLFSTLKQMLQQELGTSPGEEIMEFHHELLTLRREEKQGIQETNGFPFFGREAEIKSILSFLQQSKDNKVACINIFGPAGIGKSALINHLLPRLSRSRALWCRGHEISEKYAFSPWNGFFRDLSSDITTEKLGDPLKIHILKTHFPSFEVEYTLSPNTDFSPLLQQHNPVRLGELLAEIMRLISATQRRLIILEDIQWFDAQMIANEIKLAVVTTTEIPNERGEHTIEACEAVHAVFFVQREKQLGIAIGLELAPSRLKTRAQFTEVVDFAVVSDTDTAICREHRLLAVRHIDDREASMHHCIACAALHTAFIRAAVEKHAIEIVQKSQLTIAQSAVLGDESSVSTHMPLSHDALEQGGPIRKIAVLIEHLHGREARCATHRFRLRWMCCQPHQLLGQFRRAVAVETVGAILDEQIDVVIPHRHRHEPSHHRFTARTRHWRTQRRVQIRFVATDLADIILVFRAGPGSGVRRITLRIRRAQAGDVDDALRLLDNFLVGEQSVVMRPIGQGIGLHREHLTIMHAWREIAGRETMPNRRRVRETPFVSRLMTVADNGDRRKKFDQFAPTGFDDPAEIDTGICTVVLAGKLRCPVADRHARQVRIAKQPQHGRAPVGWNHPVAQLRVQQVLIEVKDFRVVFARIDFVITHHPAIRRHWALLPIPLIANARARTGHQVELMTGLVQFILMRHMPTVRQDA